MHWAVPWTFDDTVDFAFLLFSTVLVVAVPLVYGLRANLRDPLARSVIIGTGATAVVFTVALAFTVALHAGWTPPLSTVHWITRALYLTVALGKGTLLLAILRLIRVSRNRKAADGHH